VTPGPIALPDAIRRMIVADLRAALPNEGCGLVAGDRSPFDGGLAMRWLATRNRLASPYRFEIDPGDLLRVQLAIDDAGEVVWAVVHSHVGSEARPSTTDVRAAVHPAALHLVASFAAGADASPDLRGWRISDGVMTEVDLCGTVR
jgi:proteasome lid subunit RPN8/RPN11